MALLDGDIDRAAAAFERAAGAARQDGDGPLCAQLEAVVRLVGRLRHLRRRRDQHRAAQAALEAFEQRTLAQLLEHLFPGDHGLAPVPARGTGPRANGNILRGCGPVEAVSRAHRLSVANGHHELAVELLGSVRVAVDGVPVSGWSRGRTRSLFAYLATHRTPWPRCEVLMEVFWPGSPAAAARNSLHVAVHGVRRVVRTATSAPVIVLEGDAYGFDRTLRLRLDTEEFDELLGRAHRLQRRGNRESATSAYEAAVAVYRGDFLAENPYEDWSAATRERLRLAYLDAVGQLSICYFDTDRYAASAALCRQLVESDPCREDAWRRLMRCHARLEQPHLALRDFQDCATTVRDQLGIDPDPATVTLRNRISHRQPI